MGNISSPEKTTKEVKHPFVLKEIGFESIPYQILANNQKDFNHKKLGEKGYDFETLYVPSEELLNLSPILQQYWILNPHIVIYCFLFDLWDIFQNMDHQPLNQKKRPFNQKTGSILYNNLLKNQPLNQKRKSIQI